MTSLTPTELAADVARVLGWDAGDHHELDNCYEAVSIIRQLWAERKANRAVMEQAWEALNWSQVLLKFHVKPERCVEVGENVKSAIKIYEEQVAAITALDAALGRV